jgi:hypothetical protein
MNRTGWYQAFAVLARVVGLVLIFGGLLASFYPVVTVEVRETWDEDAPLFESRSLSFWSVIPAAMPGQFERYLHLNGSEKTVGATRVQFGWESDAVRRSYNRLRLVVTALYFFTFWLAATVGFVYIKLRYRRWLVALALYFLMAGILVVVLFIALSMIPSNQVAVVVLIAMSPGEVTQIEVVIQSVAGHATPFVGAGLASALMLYWLFQQWWAQSPTAVPTTS